MLSGPWWCWLDKNRLQFCLQQLSCGQPSGLLSAVPRTLRPDVPADRHCTRHTVPMYAHRVVLRLRLRSLSSLTAGHHD